jgi:hypothetical protein
MPAHSPWLRLGVLQTVVFDFQPRDPEDVFAALAVLSRSEIPGKSSGLAVDSCIENLA